MPNVETLGDYVNEYAARVKQALAQIPQDSLARAFKMIEDAATRGARVYVAGNGGSAAIADHLCCDWLKGTYSPGAPSVRVQSLTGSTALLTALANDVSYEECFSRQLEMQAKEGDLCVLISSSGNSPNVLRAAEAARTKKISTIGLSGFDGGKLKGLCDVSLHVPVNNYGMAEDSHQMLMHVFTQCLARKRDQR
jgi:phosphoheptose isomerase